MLCVRVQGEGSSFQSVTTDMNHRLCAQPAKSTSELTTSIGVLKTMTSMWITAPEYLSPALLERNLISFVNNCYVHCIHPSWRSVRLFLYSSLHINIGCVWLAIIIGICNISTYIIFLLNSVLYLYISKYNKRTCSISLYIKYSTKWC